MAKGNEPDISSAAYADSQNEAVKSIDWLGCPKCAKPFIPSQINKHHIGTLYESYRCEGCGLMSPTLTSGSLKGWWNTRAS